MEYKTSGWKLSKVYGKTVVAVAPQYTSQDCSTCGNTVKKTLSVRTHVCSCGTVLDRDHNAALNILAKALRQAGIDLNTLGHREINAWGHNDLYSLVATSTSKSTDWAKNPRAWTAEKCQPTTPDNKVNFTRALNETVFWKQNMKFV